MMITNVTNFQGVSQETESCDTTTATETEGEGAAAAVEAPPAMAELSLPAPRAFADSRRSSAASAVSAASMHPEK